MLHHVIRITCYQLRVAKCLCPVQPLLYVDNVSTVPKFVLPRVSLQTIMLYFT